MVSRSPEIILITMPWNDLESPSIQLGTIAEVIRAAGHSVETRYCNIRWWSYVLGHKGLRRCSLADYRRIGWRLAAVSMGEAVFAVEPFFPFKEEEFKKYLALIDSRVPEKYDRLARKLRALVPGFLNAEARAIVRSGPKTVAFSVMHSQMVPSLALATAIKQLAPQVIILFGGASCDQPMGKTLLTTFPQLDVVVSGEGEIPLRKVLPYLAQGRIPPVVPGVGVRSGANIQIEPPDNLAAIPMDLVPVPDYRPYFDALSKTAFQVEVQKRLWLPFETSRGCWWGEKHHCTFCGLNRDAMAHRSRSAAIAFDVFQTLLERHPNARLAAVDNILPPSYPEALSNLSSLRNRPSQMFFQARPSLSRQAFWQLKSAGVTRIQFGIESLNGRILALLRKYGSPIMSIGQLKIAQECGITPVWNLLVGVPGATQEDYEEIERLIPAIWHLTPPSVANVRLDRYSPYFSNPHEHGISRIRPTAYHDLLFRNVVHDTADLAYFFDCDVDEDYPTRLARERLFHLVADWQSDHRRRQRPTLKVSRKQDALHVTDHRLEGHSHMIYRLDALSSAIIELSGDVVPLHVLTKTVSRHLGVPVAPIRLAEKLGELQNKNLLLVQDERVLALPVRAKDFT